MSGAHWRKPWPEGAVDDGTDDENHVGLMTAPQAIMQLSAGVEFAGGDTTSPYGHIEQERVLAVICAGLVQKVKLPSVLL